MKKHVEHKDGAQPAQPSALFPISKDMSLEEIMVCLREDVRAQSVGQQAPMGQGKQGPAARPEPPVASKLSLEEVMRRVRGELSRRRTGAALPPSQLVTGQPADQCGLPRWAPHASALPVGREYVLGDLLQFSDAHFIDTAYRLILRRPADPAGRSHYLEALRVGALSKVEILGLIRFSDEGMRRGVHIDGLLLPYKLHRWSRIPVLGSILAFAMAVYRLPRLAARLSAAENAAAREIQSVGQLLNGIDDALEARFDGMDSSLDALIKRAELMRSDMAKMDDIHAMSARVDTVERATEVQDEALHSYKLEREQHEQELRRELIAQGEATAHLSETLRSSIAEREQHEHELRRELRAQGEAAAHLSETLRSSIAEREQHGQELRQLLSQQAEATDRQDEKVNGHKAEREQHIQQLRLHLSEQGKVTARLTDDLRAYRAEHEQHEHELRQRLNEQGSATALLERKTQEGRRSLLDVQRRLMTFLDTAVRRVSEDGARAITAQTSAGDEILNAQYVSFEDTFRGEREDIKTRATHYLETLAAAGIEKDSGVVLDLGCGRGEWLEVLTDAGYLCRGVDLNNVMLEASLARGFDVVEADVLDYLRSLEDNSLAAITSMHLVEHVPHNILIRLLDEAIRVLRPGGLLILETPNPENVTVGACYFYMDPTHRNPIPPPLLQWTVQERGFTMPVIERLSEHRGVAAIAPVSDDVPGAVQINQMIEWFTAPPDYAVIARKP
ncbi:MAG TPA: methyltransferase domain-containing protein [Acidobacteriaceae bacterium]|nr:methyltransferase domain-containing protein [Acidobacteriaceae bacterium]